MSFDPRQHWSYLIAERIAIARRARAAGPIKSVANEPIYRTMKDPDKVWTNKVLEAFKDADALRAARDAGQGKAVPDPDKVWGDAMLEGIQQVIAEKKARKPEPQ